MRKKRKLDTSRLILNATPRTCSSCGGEVWCWFPDSDSFQEWKKCNDCKMLYDYSPPIGYDERME